MSQSHYLLVFNLHSELELDQFFIRVVPGALQVVHHLVPRIMRLVLQLCIFLLQHEALLG